MYFRLVLGLTTLLMPAALAGDPPKLPPPYATPSASNAPKIIPQPGGVALRVPAGFTVSEFASGFAKPRYMVEGPGGEVLLSDSVKDGAVYVLDDANGDGRIDEGEKKKLIGGLDRPFGMAFHGRSLYVADAGHIRRYAYDAARREAGPEEMIVDLHEETQGHWTRSILFDPEGRKLYLGIGSRSNITPGDPEYRAAVLRFNPDGSGRQVVASGVRNPIGMDWNAESGKLWTVVQERDGLGDDLVPDFFTAIQEGAYYGWPYAYIGPHEEPRNAGQRPRPPTNSSGTR